MLNSQIPDTIRINEIDAALTAAIICTFNEGGYDALRSRLGMKFETIHELEAAIEGFRAGVRSERRRAAGDRATEQEAAE